jgi:hypothetical protein
MQRIQLNILSVVDALPSREGEREGRFHVYKEAPGFGLSPVTWQASLTEPHLLPEHLAAGEHPPLAPHHALLHYVHLRRDLPSLHYLLA